MKAAWRGVKAELAAGHSGWENLTDAQPLSSFGRKSKAGAVVSPETAMSLSAVWACVSRTASVIGSLPLDMYQRGDGATRVSVDHDLAGMLSESPNREQTGLEFWESMVAHTLLRGNGVAERLQVGNRLVGLRPLINADPRRDSDGDLVYDYWDRGKKYTMPASKVFHIRGFGSGDGLGLSAVRYGLQSMGAALAADEAAATFFENGMMPSGVLTSEQVLTDVQRKQLTAMLMQYAGSKKVGKIMALEAGLKYEQLQMNPEDVQLLATRRHQIEDVCRWFGTPPIVIGHSSEGQTMWGSGVEAIMLSWQTMGINPLLTRIERRIQKDLVLPGPGRRFFFEFNREAMLQMDSKSKADLLNKMVSVGILTRDEARAKLNEQARGGAADQLMAQMAMAPIENLKGNEG
ncbi:phage portal protein [Thioclava sp. GXIMD2076]